MKRLLFLIFFLCFFIVENILAGDYGQTSYGIGGGRSTSLSPYDFLDWKPPAGDVTTWAPISGTMTSTSIPSSGTGAALVNVTGVNVITWFSIGINSASQARVTLADSTAALTELYFAHDGVVVWNYIPLHHLFGAAENCDSTFGWYFGKALKTRDASGKSVRAKYYLRYPISCQDSIVIRIRKKADLGTFDIYWQAEGCEMVSSLWSKISHLDLRFSYVNDTVGNYDYVEYGMTTDTSSGGKSGSFAIVGEVFANEGPRLIPIDYDTLSLPSNAAATSISEGAWFIYSGAVADTAYPLFTQLAEAADTGDDTVKVLADLTPWEFFGSEYAVFIRHRGTLVHPYWMDFCPAHSAVSLHAADSTIVFTGDTLLEDFPAGSFVTVFGKLKSMPDAEASLTKVGCYQGSEEKIPGAFYFKGARYFVGGGWPKNAIQSGATAEEKTGIAGINTATPNSFFIQHVTPTVVSSTGPEKRYLGYWTQNFRPDLMSPTPHPERRFYDKKMVGVYWYASGAAGEIQMSPSYTASYITDTLVIDDGERDAYWRQGEMDTTTYTWADVVDTSIATITNSADNIAARVQKRTSDGYYELRRGGASFIIDDSIDWTTVYDIDLRIHITNIAGSPDSLYIFAANFSDPDSLIATAGYSAMLDSTEHITQFQHLAAIDSMPVATIARTDLSADNWTTIPIRSWAIPHLTTDNRVMLTFRIGSDVNVTEPPYTANQIAFSSYEGTYPPQLIIKYVKWE